MALCLHACNTSGQAFSVTGKIVHSNYKMVYLKKVPVAKKDVPILDSATINPDGSFTLNGKDDGQNLYALSFDGKSDLMFVNDVTIIQIETDAKDLKKYLVTNSAATNEITAFNEAMRKLDTIIGQNLVTAATIEYKFSIDSADEYIDKVASKSMSYKDSIFKEKVKATQNPATAFYMIKKAPIFYPPGYLLFDLEDDFKRFNDHPQLMALKKSIEEKEELKLAMPTNEKQEWLNKPAPNITMKDESGKPLSIKNFKGKYVLVDFWASWCVPCRRETPRLREAFNKYNSKNFTILSISMDTDKESWLKAIAKDTMPWHHLCDLQPGITKKCKSYNFKGIPFNVLLDPQGIIIAQDLRGKAVVNKLAEVLK